MIMIMITIIMMTNIIIILRLSLWGITVVNCPQIMSKYEESVPFGVGAGLRMRRLKGSNKEGFIEEN